MGSNQRSEETMECFSLRKSCDQATFLEKSARATGRMNCGSILLKPEGINIFVLFNFERKKLSNISQYRLEVTVTVTPPFSKELFF